MSPSIPAVFENGVLRPLQPLPLSEHEQVVIRIHRNGDEDERQDSQQLQDDEVADWCVTEADDSVTIEEVRRRLSKIKGSMDAAIDEDRGEY